MQQPVKATVVNICRTGAVWVCLVSVMGGDPARAQVTLYSQTDIGHSTAASAVHPVSTPTADDERHAHSEHRPGVALPELPSPPTPSNVDTGKSFWDWQHLTDDWGGRRPAMEERGFTLDADLYSDTSAALSGRPAGSPAAMHRLLFNLDLTIDTERLDLWDDGTAFIDFQIQRGPHGSDSWGDFQGFSNIDAPDLKQVSQVWLEQRYQEDRWRIKIGKVDANSEFAYSDHAGLFLNSSFGISPTIFALPTYPDPATSINVFWKPSSVVRFGVGLYDGGGVHGIPTGSRAIRIRFLGGSDLFAIGQVDVTWDDAELPGRLGLGAWYHTGDFRQFDESVSSGTGNTFLVFDQWLCRTATEDGERGLALSLQLGLADPEISEVRSHVGTGLVCYGPLWQRPEDQLGAGITWVEFSDTGTVPGSGQSETAWELIYKTRVTKWWELDFDIQAATASGGLNRPTLVTGTLRNTLRF